MTLALITVVAPFHQLLKIADTALHFTALEVVMLAAQEVLSLLTS